MKDYIIHSLFSHTFKNPDNANFYLNRYIKFIDSRKDRIIEKNAYTETHHIVPRSWSDDLRYDKNNLILLTAREHFIAHLILSHTEDSYMEYAFWGFCNQLSGDIKREYKINSIFYENAKKTFSENHSGKNHPLFNKHHTENTKIKMSKSHKDMMTAFSRDKKEYVYISKEEFKKNRKNYKSLTEGKSTYIDAFGKRYSLSKNDDLVKDGFVIPIRCGYTHSEKTKQKMSQNGIKGRRLIQNPISKETRYIKKDEKLPDGWIFGLTEDSKDEIKKKRKETFSKCKWITNGIDNKRTYNYNNLEKGWYLGRTFKKMLCPYCNKWFDILNFSQSHGEKCKMK